MLNGISDKLISRHPHIYGDVKVNPENDVKKLGKSQTQEGKKSVLVVCRVPARYGKSHTAAGKIKTGRIRMGQQEQVWDKVEEEQQELMEAVRSGDQSHIEEFGDLMFSMINCTILSIDAETALRE